MTDIQTLCSIIDPTINWEDKNLDHISNISISVNTNNRLLLLDAIKSIYWPEAVPAKMIVTTKDYRIKRAKMIITDFIRQPLKGQKFLDFGCGTGDCVSIAKEMGAEAIGYDIKPHEDWATLDGKFTTDLDEVIKNGPYDVILFYDVIDHMYKSPTDKIMWSLRKATRSRTAIYARCHPFSSRHGNHLYESLNKAYAHLFLTDNEIAELGGKPELTHTIINPEIVYPAMLNKMGFTIVNAYPVILQPESIIKAFLPFIHPLWYSKYKITDIQQIIKIISIQFVDYIMRINA